MKIVRLRHRAKIYELESKDDEFSRLTLEEHLRAGYDDTRRHCRWLDRVALRPQSDLPVGVWVHDPELEDLEAAESIPHQTGDDQTDGSVPSTAASS